MSRRAILALAPALVLTACTRSEPTRAAPAACITMTGGPVTPDREKLTPSACVTTARRPGSFSCEGEGAARRCTDAHPRQPDDGEWECSETSGVTVCRGGLAPAGVSPGSPDPGWVCGDHVVRGDAGAYPRVCVDFAPDYPRAEGWTCRYAYVNDQGVRRCEPSPATRAGDPCAGGACPSGTTCASGRCLPDAPAPRCFFDTDCDAPRKCVFGSCRAG